MRYNNFIPNIAIIPGFLFLSVFFLTCVSFVSSLFTYKYYIYIYIYIYIFNLIICVIRVYTSLFLFFFFWIFFVERCARVYIPACKSISLLCFLFLLSFSKHAFTHAFNFTRIPFFLISCFLCVRVGKVVRDFILRILPYTIDTLIQTELTGEKRER